MPTRQAVRSRFLAGSMALAAGLLAASRARAADGVAYRVRDLRTLTQESDCAQMYALGTVGGRAVVAVEDEGAGLEPWITDGTAPGTRLLADLHPGGGGSYPAFVGSVPGILFFRAATPGQGFELWATEGTPAGTRLVADVRPGPLGSYPAPLGTIGGTLYFGADDGVHGFELWRTDGTTEGTRLLLDVRPGPLGGIVESSADAARHANLGHRVYFAADDGVHGTELWRTDGSSAGTHLFRSVVPGGTGGEPRDFRSVGGRLFFSARTAAHGREIWISDGTGAGTMLLRDLRTGVESSDLEMLARHAGELFFRADDGVHGLELWLSDGTTSGTRLVRDIRAGPLSSFPGYTGIGAVGERLVFEADDGTHGREPWTTDGSSTGTFLLADLFPGTGSSEPESFGAGFGGVVFAAFGPDYQPRLYATDGTPAGAQAFAELEEAGLSDVYHLGDLGGRIVLRLYFEGFHFFDNQLWSSDGSAAGTGEVVDFGPPTSPSRAQPILGRDGGILLNAGSDDGGGLFRSDGTEEGTYPVVGPGGDRTDGSSAHAVLGDGTVLISTSYGSLLRIDGDLATAVAPGSGPQPSDLHHLTRVGSSVANFTGTEIEHGTELWRTDGTSAGTWMVPEIEPGFGDSDPTRLTDVFGTLWFASLVPPFGFEPWESRGTAATTIVHDLNLGPISGGTLVERFAPLAASRGSVAFEVEDRLYALEPPDPAARLLHEFVPGIVWERAFAHLGDELYFFDPETDGRCALWKTDGSSTGTVRVRATGAGSAGDPCPGQIVRLGGRLYFGACTGATGCELWTSDGTFAGTFRLADLEPGARSLSPSAMTVVGDRLYFSGCQAATGCEPWVTDGSAAGSHRLADIWPGPRSGFASYRTRYFNAWHELVESEGLVYFGADDGTGTELWAMPLEIFYDGFESGSTSRWSAP